ncbi:MAG: endonuclease III [Candidatus Bathyarchaeota archaeon]|nr:endonuclease III [Candidatus Bathyarchaeota archaeon]
MDRGREALRRLLDHYRINWRPDSGDPFRSLVRIILSQNTSYKNEAVAYQRLEESIGVTPASLAYSAAEAIAEAIRPAGMHNQRSKTLKSVAEVVLEKYGGDIEPVLDKPYYEAREELMALPGVGQKTADVLLMFDAGKEVIPVDRHIFRITKRLQLVPENAGYEEVRRAIKTAAPPERHVDVHVLLIRFGREICQARNPKCSECFLLDICPYPKRQSPA